MNIDRVLERGERLEDVMSKSDSMRDSALTFSKKGRALHRKARPPVSPSEWATSSTLWVCTCARAAVGVTRTVASEATVRGSARSPTVPHGPTLGQTKVHTQRADRSV